MTAHLGAVTDLPPVSADSDEAGERTPGGRGGRGLLRHPLRVVAAPRPAVCWRPFGAFWWGRWPVTWGSRPRLYAIAPSGLGEEGRHSPEGAPAYSLGREPQD